MYGSFLLGALVQSELKSGDGAVKHRLLDKVLRKGYHVCSIFEAA